MSRSRIFHLYEDVTIAGEGLQNLGLCSALRAFDLYRATPAVTRDLGFSGLIRRTAPFSRLLRHTRGCGGSILTRILTGKIKIKANTFTDYRCPTSAIDCRHRKQASDDFSIVGDIITESLFIREFS
jgi:hypothetical protein